MLTDLAQVRYVTKLVIVVHAVTDSEGISDQEASVVRKVAPIDVFGCLFVERDGNPQRLQLEYGLQLSEDGAHCSTCVDHILDKKHVLSADTDLFNFIDALDFSRALSVDIAAQFDEVGADAERYLSETQLFVQLHLQILKELVSSVHKHDYCELRFASVVCQDTLG